MEIKPYQSEYFSQLKEIWNGVIEKGEAFLYEKPFSDLEFKQLLLAQNAVECAIMEDEVAGFYILHPNQPGRGKHVANASYAVKTSCQGLGIGKELGKHSLEQAKRLGFSAVQFNSVVASNTSAVKLWESLGFIRIGEVPDGYKRKENEMTALYIYYKNLI